MCEQDFEQLREEVYLPGYFWTPEIHHELNIKPTLRFVLGDRYYSLLLKGNKEAGAPAYSAFVSIETVVDGIPGKGEVSHRVCGGVTELAALKGINLLFGEEAYRRITQQRGEAING